MSTPKEPTKANEPSDHVGASTQSEQPSAPTGADIPAQGGEPLHPTPTGPSSETPVRAEPTAPTSGDDDEDDDEFIPRGKPTATVAGGGKKGAGRP